MIFVQSDALRIERRRIRLQIMTDSVRMRESCSSGVGAGRYCIAPLSLTGWLIALAAVLSGNGY